MHEPPFLLSFIFSSVKWVQWTRWLSLFLRKTVYQNHLAVTLHSVSQITHLLLCLFEYATSSAFPCNLLMRILKLGEKQLVRGQNNQRQTQIHKKYPSIHFMNTFDYLPCPKFFCWPIWFPSLPTIVPNTPKLFPLVLCRFSSSKEIEANILKKKSFSYKSKHIETQNFWIDKFLP